MRGKEGQILVGKIGKCCLTFSSDESLSFFPFLTFSPFEHEIKQKQKQKLYLFP